MSLSMRGVGLLVFAGACLALLGCWETESDRPKTTSQPKPNVGLEEAAMLLREKHFAAHHDRCVEVFVKAENVFGHERMPRLSHRHDDYPKSLDLPAEADPPDVSLPGL